MRLTAKHWQSIALLLVAIGVAAVLRLVGIGWGLPTVGNYHQSFHPDEAHKLRVITSLDLSQLQLNPHWFVKGTLQFYILGAAFKVADLAGLVELRSSWAYADNPDQLARLYLIGRVLTVTMSLATVVLTFVLGSLLYNRWVGLAAALLMSVLPVEAVNAHYMKTDVPMAFWLSVGGILAIMIWRHGSWRWYLATGLVIGLATATKYSSLAFWGVPLIAHLFRLTGSPNPTLLLRHLLSPRLLLLYGSALLGFLAGCPYCLLAFDEFKAGIMEPFEPNTRNDLFLDGMERGPILAHYLTNIMYYSLGLPLHVLALAGMAFALWRRRKAEVFLLAWLVPYLVSANALGYGFARYLVPLGPPMMLLVAALFNSIVKAPGLVSIRPVKAIALASLGAALLYSALYSFAYVSFMAKEDVRDEASRWIRDNIPSNSRIGLARPYFYTPTIDEKRYLLLKLDMDAQALRNEEPDYFLITNYEYRQYLRMPDTFPAEAAFMAYLDGGREYKEIQTFERSPSLMGIKLPNAFPPHDWMYPYPTIRIFKRADNS